MRINYDIHKAQRNMALQGSGRIHIKKKTKKKERKRGINYYTKMNTFRRKSVTPKPAVVATTQQRPSITIKPLEYVLENIEKIKFSYYQNGKLLLGEETVANFVLFFSDNSPVQIPSTMIQCSAVSSMDPEHIECIVQETAFPGQYTITFTPITRGVYELHIKINHTTDIRYSVRAPVSIPPWMRSTPTNTFTRLKYPYAVEVLRDGTMIVTEYFSHRITMLDKNGRFIQSIGSHGNKIGEFNHPSGLAITPRGTLLVADRDNNRIQELRLNGEFLSCVGRRGIGPLRFNKPEGIAVNPTSGMVFIADCYNHRVQVLHPDLSFSHFIGSLGENPGEFKHPFDLTFDNQGFVYVTDRCNDRIQKWTPDGQMCTVLRMGLDNPTGITIDDQGALFICEYGLDLITTISSKGQFIPCELQGRCRGPYGIKFNPFNGDIIVCDTRNNRLLVF